MTMKEIVSMFASQTEGAYDTVAQRLDDVVAITTTTTFTPAKKSAEFRSAVTFKGEVRE